MQGRLVAEEIRVAADETDSLLFSLPIALLLDRENVYVLDSQEGEVRVFSRDGRFRRTLGRKGQGPGEMESPGDMDIEGKRIFIADRGNRRVVILDLEGRAAGGFKVRFFPDQILALRAESGESGEIRIVVSHLPGRGGGRERMLHCFTTEGEIIWEAFDSYFSGDPIYDTFRNLHELKKNAEGRFFIICKCNDRTIYEWGREGGLEKKTKLDDAYRLRKLTVSTKRGRKELLGIHWNCDYAAGKFYLLAPEHTEEKDLGPGSRIAIIDEEGELEGWIDLPEKMIRIAVDGDRVYGIDRDYRLRLFQVEAK